MRLAFVLRLAKDTRPSESHFEGWIEEVDSGKEVRFRSTEELLRFLAQRFIIQSQQWRMKVEPNQGNGDSSTDESKQRIEKQIKGELL